MSNQYSFLATCQQAAQDELSHSDAVAVSIPQPGQPEQKVKKREKLFSLLGGLLHSKSQNSDSDGKGNHAADAHAHENRSEHSQINLYFPNLI